MNIINMTPHDINIINGATIPSSGTIRLKAETVPAGQINGINLTKTVYSEPVGLPEIKEGTLYIVSQLVKTALPDRVDLLVPAEVVRDDKGNIIGCKSLGI
jgi:hypothetical protein